MIGFRYNKPAASASAPFEPQFSGTRPRLRPSDCFGVEREDEGITTLPRQNRRVPPVDPFTSTQAASVSSADKASGHREDLRISRADQKRTSKDQIPGPKSEKQKNCREDRRDKNPCAGDFDQEKKSRSPEVLVAEEPTYSSTVHGHTRLLAIASTSHPS